MMNKPEEKLKLFDSEGEEENYDSFKLRPQYEGPHGQKVLEINSQLSKRFKLDERFADDFTSESLKDDTTFLEENEEKGNNIRILETVLGHEITTKFKDKTFAKKKQIRFDPDDENSSRLIKSTNTVSEKRKKSKKRKEIMEEKTEQIIPHCSERYTEVCPDLKEILNTSTPFSFSQNFISDTEQLEDKFKKDAFLENTDETEIQNTEKKKKNETDSHFQNLSTVYFTPKSKCEVFFITEGDPRLKEGVEFFKRSKAVEEIRMDWQKKRKHILELFKRRRPRTQSHSVRTMQIKNAIRRRKL